MKNPNITDALTLLVRTLSDEVEARFEKSFAEREAKLNKLRVEILEEIEEKLKVLNRCMYDRKLW